jgi:hypothetical protein
VPSLPGFPPPGHKSPFPDVSKLVTLQSYGVYFESDRLVVHAQATVVNPLPETFTLAAPSLPFTVSVSPMNSSGPVIPVASTHNEAFALTHPNITVSVSGYVLPLSASSLPTLSDFLSRYLSSKSNTIQVSTPIFPGLTFDVIVPGPHPRPQVLRNVTIHNMSIHPTVGSMFVASGTIFAQLVLPKGVDIEAEVYRVFPDVLVFDGEVPDDAGTVMQEDLRHVDETPSFPPPPDPLPERAFAHIRPEDWVPSVSCPAPRGPDEGASYYVTGTIHNVPLQVLPGREKIFTDFVTKVCVSLRLVFSAILTSDTRRSCLAASMELWQVFSERQPPPSMFVVCVSAVEVRWSSRVSRFEGGCAWAIGFGVDDN